MENQEPLFMIVDDEPDMCWALKNILKKSGYNCEKALSGREAMRLLKSQKFHLAFLDVKLPDIEGLELAASHQVRRFRCSHYYDFRVLLHGRPGNSKSSSGGLDLQFRGKAVSSRGNYQVYQAGALINRSCTRE